MLFSLKYDDENPLFSVAFHPTEPQFVVGTATGWVSCYSYDSKQPNESGEVVPVEKWTTKRHKGSCRAIVYNYEGTRVVTCGSEGVIKVCNSDNGKVIKKTSFGKAAATALTINEEYIVTGDENAVITVYKHDLTVHQVYKLQDDNIDSISVIKPLRVNKHNFVVGCNTFVLRLDVRKPEIAVKSADQEDEVLSGCVCSDVYSAFGMSEGILTVWKNKGLTDQQQRVKLSQEGSVDSVLAGEVENTVIAGTSDGNFAKIDVVSGKVLYQIQHAAEDVLYLDYDYEYRLVTASMSVLKVWDINEPEQLHDQKLALEKEKEKTARGENKKRKSKTSNKKNKSKVVVEKENPFADLLG